MIYGFLSTVAFVLILPFWLILGIFKPKLVCGFREKCGLYLPLAPTGRGQGEGVKTILFYGVSVGEVLAMENLIKKTRETFSDINIILLTGTKTGQEIAHKKLGETADFISYFPFDFPFCIENMLKKLQPDAVFVMETELWPNFATIMKKRKIPLFIINGRISDRTYKSYKKLSFFFRPILEKYTAIYTQSAQDNEKLVSIGANPYTTKIMGNLKFDIKKPDISEFDFEKNPSHKIILAGSTHKSEDEIIIEAFMELKKEIPDIKLIIAPRHPERNESVFELMKKTGLNCCKRSDNPPRPSGERVGVREQKENPFNHNDVILLDTMGELGKFYSICDIAFLGGSFNKTGGHNPLEATIFKKPVISGPNTHNFKDIYSILTNSKAAKVVKTKESLIEELKHFLTNEGDYSDAIQACEDVFEQNRGALDFVINILQTLV